MLAGPSARLHRASRTTPCVRPTCWAERLEPGPVLLEHVAQRPLGRRKRERHAIRGDLDLLRLRHDGAVEHHLRLADLREPRVLEVVASTGSARRLRRTAQASAGRRRARFGADGSERAAIAASTPAAAPSAGAAAGEDWRDERPPGAALGRGSRARRRSTHRRERRRSDLRSAPACAGGSSAAAPSRGDSAAARRRGCRPRRGSADRTRAAGPRERSAAASARAASRSPSPAISGSLARDGSTESTSRSRTTRDSSRQTRRRS